MIGYLFLTIATLTLFQWFQVRDQSALSATVDVELRTSIDQFPYTIGDWKGTTIEEDRPESLYGDSSIYRSYTHTATGRTVTLWMAYSSTGEHRAHHPQVCMRASGHLEVSDLQSTVPMNSATGDEPARHFVFEKISNLRRVHVIYWYYVLDGSAPPASLFRTPGLRYASAGPSVIIELFAHDFAPGDAQAIDGLALQIDQLMKEYLPSSATRGNERSSFMMIRDAQLTEG